MEARVVDSYKVLAEIGHGGMASVFRARDVQLERDVALKILHEHIAADPENRERFVREARAVARLRHRNIIQIYGFSLPGSEVGYIATELVNGPTLREFRRPEHSEFPEIGAMICALIADALQHAHEEGVLHRDIKPENIMIGDDGVPRLMDFGLARMLDAHRVTMTGSLLGSPAHMAPEIIEGQDYDQRVDIFSLGTILYFLCTGELPFQGSNPAAVLRQILEGTYPPPARLTPHVGRELASILDRMLSRDPGRRPASAEEVARQLRDWLAGMGIERPDEEFARFYEDPDVWMNTARTRFAHALVENAERELTRGRAGWASALALCDRALLLVPDQAGALQLVASLNRKQRLRQHAKLFVAFGLLLLMTGGSLFALHARQQRREAQLLLLSAQLEQAARSLDGAHEQARFVLARELARLATLRACDHATTAAMADGQREARVQVRDRAQELLYDAWTQAQDLALAQAARQEAGGRPGRGVGTEEGAELDLSEVGVSPEAVLPTYEVTFHLQPPVAELWVDGALLCASGGRCVVPLAYGQHQIRVRHPQTGMELSERIRVQGADAVFRYRVPWRPATLMVESERPGLVLFNGRRVGRTGRAIEIPVEGIRSTVEGTLQVIPDGAFGSPVERQITLTSGQVRREPVTF